MYIKFGITQKVTDKTEDYFQNLDATKNPSS